MFIGESLPQFAAVQLEFGDGGLDIRSASQQSLRLKREIDGSVALLISVQRCLGGIEVLLQDWQLLFQKLKSFRSLGALALDVLAHVILGNGVKNSGQPVR